MQNTYNIAILGAGIMGLSAAYALSKRGTKVTLFDPAGFPANNASLMAGGMLAPYSEIEHMNMSWIDAGMEGIRLWQQNFPELVKQNGSLFIAHDEDRYILERFKSHLPPAQNIETINAQALEPNLPAKFVNGLYIKDEAHLNPQDAIPALVAALKKLNVTFKAETASNTNAFDFIIDARGLASSDKNLRGVKGEILIVRNPEFKLSRPVRLMHPRYPLYIVPRENNIFMIGATQIESADTHVTLRSGLELMSALYSLHPSFGESEIIEIKAGIRPAYPDNLPRIRINENVISCNGLFRHGFLLGPVMAKCVADYIEDHNNKFISLFTGEDRHDDHHRQRPEKKLPSAA